jgi:hypothetical protein
MSEKQERLLVVGFLGVIFGGQSSIFVPNFLYINSYFHQKTNIILDPSIPFLQIKENTP